MTAARTRAWLLLALIGAAASLFGLLGSPGAAATGAGQIAVVSSHAGLSSSTIELIPSGGSATAANTKVLATVEHGGFFDLQWTPDGKTLVYAEQTGKASSPVESIYAVDATTLRRRLLAANVVGGRPESVSPDGKTVAYIPATKASSYSVYLVGVAGGSPRRLVPGRFATWSPDGRRLVVGSAVGNDFVTVNADGTGAVRVRFSPSKSILVNSIAWEPRGNSLLVDLVDLAPYEDRVEIVSLAGHAQRALSSKSIALTGVWSPSGTQVAFAEGVGAKQSVVVVSPNGSGRHSVYAAQGNVSIGWSPDGRSLVTANGRQVRVVRADGTGARVVATAAGTDSLDDPAWRPGS